MKKRIAGWIALLMTLIFALTKAVREARPHTWRVLFYGAA